MHFVLLKHYTSNCWTQISLFTEIEDVIKFLGKVKCKWCVKYLEKVRLVRSYEYQKVHYLWAKTAVIHGDEIEHIVSEAKRRKEVKYIV